MVRHLRRWRDSMRANVIFVSLPLIEASSLSSWMLDNSALVNEPRWNAAPSMGIGAVMNSLPNVHTGLRVERASKKERMPWRDSSIVL